MINPLIVQEVFANPLCIERNYATSIAMAVASTFFGVHKPVEHGQQMAVCHYEPACAIEMSGARSSKDHKPGSVGLVTIDGPILENSDAWYGIMGTIEAGAALASLDADPNIIGNVLVLESGGGSAYAIKPIRDVIKARTKPLVVVSRKIIASAAFGIAADADAIMMYHPQGIVGSFGTMSSSQDMQPMFEKWGMKFSEFYATKSTLKNKTSRDARNGDPTALIENVLDPFNEVYLANIQEDRGDKITSKDKRIWQGETFLATDSKDMGLIDALGYIPEAVAKVRELHEQRASLHSNNPNSNMKFTAVMALAGVTNATKEQLQAANAELAEAGITGVALFNESVVTDAAQATTDLEKAKQDLATAQGSVTALTTENTGLKAKIAQLPGVAAAAAVPPVDPPTEKTEAQKEAETIANYGHNKFINSYFGGK